MFVHLHILLERVQILFPLPLPAGYDGMELLHQVSGLLFVLRLVLLHIGEESLFLNVFLRVVVGDDGG